jgi:hypothetical protein
MDHLYLSCFSEKFISEAFFLESLYAMIALRETSWGRIVPPVLADVMVTPFGCLFRAYIKEKPPLLEGRRLAV